MSTGTQRHGWAGWYKEKWEHTFGKRKESNLLENWPSGARMAVMLSFDTEGDIDAGLPGYRGGHPGQWRENVINYTDVGERQYDLRGLPRILRLLDKYSIKGTFPMPGLTAEWYPEMLESIAAAGHEVAVHGDLHRQLFELTEDQEREEIERATASIEAVLGKRPVGWRSPLYSITPNTIRLLTEAGYLYNTDLHNDDFPYLLENDGRSLVEIPAGLDDWYLYLMNVPGISMGGVPYGVPWNVTDILISFFEMLYEESEEGPTVMQYAAHPKITGRPHRAYGLEQFIKHTLTRPGVWYCTIEELARLCL